MSGGGAARGVAHALMAGALLGGLGGTEVLKRVTRVERPDGTNRLSFPSGHAERAFSSAAYGRARQGLLPSVPLYAAALFRRRAASPPGTHRAG